MIEKHNDATPNRPAGERVIDAPAVSVDIKAFIAQIKSEETWSKYDRNSITVFKTNNLRIVVGGLHKGAELSHDAEGVMSVQVLEGILDVVTEELSVTLEKNQLVAIHKGNHYRMLATEEVIYLLTIADVS